MTTPGRLWQFHQGPAGTLVPYLYMWADPGEAPGFSRRSRAGRLDLDQPFLYGVEDRLRPVVDPELLVHVADVVANRLLADLQAVSNLLVGHPARQELEDLDLPVGQPVVELLRSRGPCEHVEDSVGNGARHDLFPGHHGHDAADDCSRRGVLQDVTAGPGLQRLDDLAVGFERGQDQYLDARDRFHDLPSCFDAVDVGHLDVHEHDVRLQLGGLLDSIGAVDRLADDLHPLIITEQACEAGPEERLIVDYEYACGSDGYGHELFLFATITVSCDTSRSFGNIARTRVPWPFSLSTRICPPRNMALSRIPIVPMPTGREGSVSTPRPSSSTTIPSSFSAWGPSTMRTLFAPLCIRMLESASSMIR